VFKGLYLGFVRRDDQRTETAVDIRVFVFAFGQVVYTLVPGLMAWLKAWQYQGVVMHYLHLD
jgi:hypothetical protein